MPNPSDLPQSGQLGPFAQRLQAGLAVEEQEGAVERERSQARQGRVMSESMGSMGGSRDPGRGAPPRLEKGLERILDAPDR